MGISKDESYRAKDSRIEYINHYFPLIDLGITRTRCMTIIQNEGLPVPPKSSCFFCPFHRDDQWIKLKENQPELFKKAVELEKYLNYKREKIGKDEVYFHQALKPLEEAVKEDPQDRLFDGCDEGFCFI